MGRYETILTVLQYAAPAVTVVAGYWAATHVTSREEGGRKRLTRAGWVGVWFAVLGATIIVATTYLKTTLDRERAARNAEAEKKTARRTILAGQPLRSLALDWTFTNVGEAVSQSIRIGRDKVRDDYREAFFNVPTSTTTAGVLSGYYTLAPMLRNLAEGLSSGRSSGGPMLDDVLAIVSFDPSRSAVLPFGQVTLEHLPTAVRSRIESKHEQYASGVRVFEDLEQVWDNAPLLYSRPASRLPEVRQTGSASVSIHWDMDASTLDNAIDYQSQRAPLTANLPDEIQVALVHEVKRLPFDGVRLASMVDCSPWAAAKQTPLQSRHFASSSILLVPNGSEDGTARYTLKSIVLNPAVDEYTHACPFTSVLLTFRETAAP